MLSLCEGSVHSDLTYLSFFTVQLLNKYKQNSTHIYKERTYVIIVTKLVCNYKIIKIKHHPKNKNILTITNFYTNPSLSYRAISSR